MAKEKQLFFCKECGYESPKWMGQCPGCREWNTFADAPKAVKGRQSSRKYRASFGGDRMKPSRITDIETAKEDRESTGIGELDRVLGGGIVRGSLTLVGGDPGIGKSTLLLQMCRTLSASGNNVLYVSGEESLKQIKMRADRIGDFLTNMLLLSETCLDIVEGYMVDGCEFAGGNITVPDIVVIDSIQTRLTPPREASVR